MRLLINEMLRCALIHVSMRLELKQEVQNVDEEKNLFKS